MVLCGIWGAGRVERARGRLQGRAIARRGVVLDSSWRHFLLFYTVLSNVGGGGFFGPRGKIVFVALSEEKKPEPWEKKVRCLKGLPENRETPIPVLRGIAR
jgi:hypothetical protein